MNETEILTRYTAHFVDELVQSGVRHAVISPGSRSTPLAMTFSEHKDIEEYVIIDERSAAFFALGIANKTKKPVVLVCTSGTAAANYFPAIIEAYHSRIPLIVLTTDRPHELRDVGAPQAIDQLEIFGSHVKWFQEMALPEASKPMLDYVRSKAAYATHMSQTENPGPVHLNFPFREPLIPDFSLDNLWGSSEQVGFHPTYSGKKRLATVEIEDFLESLSEKKRGLIVCGSQFDEAFPEAVVALAEKWGLPILADPLSQVRSGKHNKAVVIESYDAILRHEQIRNNLKPDFIIRFGAFPVSKSYLFYTEENESIPQYVIENSTGFRDPSGNPTKFIYADSTLLCYDLKQSLKDNQVYSSWLNTWQKINEIAKTKLTSASENMITEGEVLRSVVTKAPNDSCLYVGNSMAIRDLDTFFMTTDKKLNILANRGVNGIDGLVSSALGAAIGEKEVTLVLGDLSFYHDLNGLLAASHYNFKLTIVLINNDGGGIFSFLPQVKEKAYFEPLFGTPLGIDFAHVVRMYGGKYELAKTEMEFQERLTASYEHQGLSVIEVKTDREQNLTWHKKKWAAINKELLAYDW